MTDSREARVGQENRRNAGLALLDVSELLRPADPFCAVFGNRRGLAYLPSRPTALPPLHRRTTLCDSENDPKGVLSVEEVTLGKHGDLHNSDGPACITTLVSKARIEQWFSHGRRTRCIIARPDGSESDYGIEADGSFTDESLPYCHFYHPWDGEEETIVEKSFRHSDIPIAHSDWGPAVLARTAILPRTSDGGFYHYQDSWLEDGWLHRTGGPTNVLGKPVKRGSRVILRASCEYYLDGERVSIPRYAHLVGCSLNNVREYSKQAGDDVEAWWLSRGGRPPISA